MTRHPASFASAWVAQWTGTSSAAVMTMNKATQISTSLRTLMAMMAVMVAFATLPGAALAQDGGGGDQANQPIELSVRSIHAVPDGKSIDPKLADMEGTLTKAFEGYGDFKDLGTIEAKVDVSGTGDFKLPDGTALKITYKGATKDLIRLGLAVGDKFKSDVRAGRGGTFFQAGLPYEGGILIIAITVR